MDYIDQDLMSAIDAQAFRTTLPFPWSNPVGFLRAKGFKRLIEELPPLERFTSRIDGGRRRKYGQPNHDRYVLEYREEMDLSASWRAFIDELRGDEYRAFIASMLGHDHFRFRFHWHYTPNGCSVSPHCDSRTKLGSHIFYLNTESDWDPAWGGETVILDDGGRFDTEAHPEFADFDAVWPAVTMPNRSLIFSRRGNSWHGVRAIDCPDDCLRKVFIVVFEEYRAMQMLRKRVVRLLKGKPLVAEKERGMY